MLYPLYTNKQINIPYLLKIGDGKVKKIGKYLADKNLTNAVIFWSEGIQRLLADRLYPGLEENGVKAGYEQDVRFCQIQRSSAQAALCFGSDVHFQRRFLQSEFFVDC